MEIYLPRIGAGARHHQFGLVLAGQPGHLVEINSFSVLADPVTDDFVELAGEIEAHAVG